MSNAIFTTITENIIRAMEAGTPPWVRPWSTVAVGGALPLNASTGRPYNGVNALHLWAIASMSGFSSHAWMTFNQAKSLGGFVRKGEKGTAIVFWRPFEKGTKADGTKDRGFVLKNFTVFNVAQIDGIDGIDASKLHGVAIEGQIHNDPHGDLVAAAERMGVTVQSGSRFCYFPARDSIEIVPTLACSTHADQTAGFAHELAHATGHKSRLDRSFSGRFGDKAYATEELVAELAAAFICAELRVDGELQHASYLAHWIGVLRSDPKAIVTVASAAQKAAKMVLGTAEAEATADDATTPESAGTEVSAAV